MLVRAYMCPFSTGIISQNVDRVFERFIYLPATDHNNSNPQRRQMSNVGKEISFSLDLNLNLFISPAFSYNHLLLK